MPAGRPSLYTEEIAEQICERMSEGETLREVCRDPNMPAQSTVFRWLAKNDAFREQYTRAREALIEHWADEIIEISEDGSNDWMLRQRDDDDPVVVLNHEHIARSKLRVDSRKWLMSKLAPKKYGDKLQTEHSGSVTISYEDALADLGKAE